MASRIGCSLLQFGKMAGVGGGRIGARIGKELKSAVGVFPTRDFRTGHVRLAESDANPKLHANQNRMEKSKTKKCI